MIKKTISISVAILAMSGCGSKHYFKPENTASASSQTQNFGNSIAHINKDSATFEDGNVISKNAVIKFKMPQGFHLVNSISEYLITANALGDVNVVHPEGRSKTIHFEKPLLAGTLLSSGVLVYLLQDNSYGMYDLQNDKITYHNKSDKVYAIDTKIANPLIIDNLAVIPSLSGKLVILNTQNATVVKELYVSTQSSLNNVIFLKSVKNTLISATPHNVIFVDSKGKGEYKADISNVETDGESIFVFTKDGKIIQLDESLKMINEKKFQFAHFSSSGISADKLFALDKQGFLIVANKSLSKSKVYKLEEVDESTFLAHGKLFYDGLMVDVDKLSFE
jgi:hypothetical protein